ncbi:MAG: HNH endonuclease [Desulfurivibrio sp.]|nr:HNH endonuclease [Desulfurivibrio sp.]MBU4034045.1 HNH endonuclease [Pseudomonadota bacterium]MBU4119786.1 HNH endonuclease [Pseudomonadota bacterium]
MVAGFFRLKCFTVGSETNWGVSLIFHVDHIELWSKGGETVLENLQTLCSVCNLGKSNNDAG